MVDQVRYDADDEDTIPEAPMRDLFNSWLEKTRVLQLEAYGNDLDAIEGQELRTYLTWNHSAAVIEMGELLEEVRWKPWANWEEGDPVVPNHGAFVSEAVDVLHFVANMLCAAGVTDEELDTAYQKKMAVNRERQARSGGYQSIKGIDKCERCGRSFDDVGRASTEDPVCIFCVPASGSPS